MADEVPIQSNTDARMCRYGYGGKAAKDSPKVNIVRRESIPAL